MNSSSGTVTASRRAWSDAKRAVERRDRLAHVRLLAHQRRLALDLRREARRLGVERHEAVELLAHHVAPRRVEAGGDRVELARELRVALLLRREVAAGLRELLHRELHLHEPPLQPAHFGEQRAPPLVERLHVVRHLQQLLEPPLVVLPVHAHGLDLAVEQVEHRAQAARRADARTSDTRPPRPPRRAARAAA